MTYKEIKHVFHFSVEVDAQQIFKPGQLGVAMGRVRTSDCLRIVNFHPRVCKPQPVNVDAFLRKESAPVHEDLSCCTVPFGYFSFEIYMPYLQIQLCYCFSVYY